jgi:uncharacterized protein (TIGR03437 family)
VLTGATLDGRALAQSGAVTVDTGGASHVGIPVTSASSASIIFPVNTTNNSAGTVNDASYVPSVVAGSIAAVFGSGLSVGQSSPEVSTPLATSLAQSSFVIGGRAAPLYFASPAQVNLQIPWEMAGQTGSAITATVAGVASNTQLVNLVPFAPGIFTMNMMGTGQGKILVANTAQLATVGTPASRGGYVAIFCTGPGAGHQSATDR